jgi:hypothetical protein
MADMTFLQGLITESLFRRAALRRNMWRSVPSWDWVNQCLVDADRDWRNMRILWKFSEITWAAVDTPDRVLVPILTSHSDGIKTLRITEFSFIWVNNLKFADHRKSIAVTQGVHFATHFSAPLTNTAPTHLPAAMTLRTCYIFDWWKKQLTQTLTFNQEYQTLSIQL